MMFVRLGHIVIRVLPVLALLLVVVELVVANELAGLRGSVKDNDVAIASLQDENDILSREVASASALATIAKKAYQAGFVQPSKSQYLILDTLPVAANLPANERAALH